MILLDSLAENKDSEEYEEALAMQRLQQARGGNGKHHSIQLSSELVKEYKDMCNEESKK